MKETNPPVTYLSLMKFHKYVPKYKMTGKELYEQYVYAAKPSFERLGIKVLDCLKVGNVVVGSGKWDMIIAVRYHCNITELLADEDYRRIEPLRLNALKSYLTFEVETDELLKKYFNFSSKNKTMEHV